MKNNKVGSYDKIITTNYREGKDRYGIISQHATSNRKFTSDSPKLIVQAKSK